MKKTAALFLTAAMAFSASGCGEMFQLRPGIVGDLSNSETSEKPALELSDDMFDGVSLSIGILEKDTLGIVVEREPDGEGIAESYFVWFGEDGAYEKVTFEKETDDGGTRQIGQEEIEGMANNLYVTEKFVFFSFSENSPDPSSAGEPEFFSHDWGKVFAADRSTGKIYSLNGFSNVKPTGGSIIRARRPGDSYGSYAYYLLRVENGVLSETELMPNENVRVYSVEEDIFGNVYVYNSEINGTNGNIIYVTDSIYKGTDGCCYQIEGELYFDDYLTESMRTIEIYRMNEAGERETGDDFYTNFSLSGNILCVRGEEIFQQGGTYLEGSNAYGRYTDGYFSPRAYIPFLWAPYFVSDCVVVGTNEEGELHYYNFATVEWDGDRETVSFSEEGGIPLDGELYSKGGQVFVRTEELYGTVLYRLFENERGGVGFEEFSPQEPDENVLVMQSLE